MSQYTLQVESPAYGPVTVLWGWDAPLGTFFLSILDPQDELISGIGNRRGEIAQPETILASWPDYAVCPLDLVYRLQADKTLEGCTWGEKNPAIQAYLEQLEARMEERLR